VQSAPLILHSFPTTPSNANFITHSPPHTIDSSALYSTTTLHPPLTINSSLSTTQTQTTNPPLPATVPKTTTTPSLPFVTSTTHQTTTHSPLSPRITQAKRRRPIRGPSPTQRSILLMSAASSKIILERLKEEWSAPADASFYRELELEKQRWMLFALRDLKATRLGDREKGESADRGVGSTGCRILSLFENHGKSWAHQNQCLEVREDR
jgi:hypothetical protein